jgi:predicted RNA binding protein YcfA (HicA-like mRNA interferase family)
MTRLPRLSGREVIDALGKAGFQVTRVKGHRMLRHADGRATTVPVHGAEIIGPGLLIRVLRDCGLSRDDFVDLSRR